MFNHRLEALRGVAALMVAVGHCLISLSIHGDRQVWALRPFEQDAAAGMVVRAGVALFNGSAAVTIFFVLSGLVLTYRLNRDANYPRFMVSRVARLIPAAAVCIAITTPLVYLAFPPAAVAGGSDWLNALYRVPFSWSALLPNMALLRVDYLAIAWTLRVEMIASALLPAFYLWRRWAGPKWDLPALGVLIAIPAALGSNHMTTLPNLPAFYLGMTITTWGPLVAGRGLAAILSGVALILGPRSLMPAYGLVAHLLEAAGAWLLISACVYAPKGLGTLDHPLARFYGRISYSFYLYHFAVMFAAFRLVGDLPSVATHPVVWTLVVIVASVAIATPIAWASHRFVEVPSSRWGRQAARPQAAPVPAE